MHVRVHGVRAWSPPAPPRPTFHCDMKLPTCAWDSVGGKGPTLNVFTRPGSGGGGGGLLPPVPLEAVGMTGGTAWGCAGVRGHCAHAHPAGHGA